MGNFFRLFQSIYIIGNCWPNLIKVFSFRQRNGLPGVAHLSFVGTNFGGQELIFEMVSNGFYK
ncbi:hypothetical protein D1BOALGB6SA_9769 [Olavius sp. associated proteobacterium Delta 1]|nr:hypothetical protein D1BOALGB6SA_9769 [Olavius sp. associated proteobacterium Delta 1]